MKKQETIYAQPVSHDPLSIFHISRRSADGAEAEKWFYLSRRVSDRNAATCAISVECTKNILKTLNSLNGEIVRKYIRRCQILTRENIHKDSTRASWTFTVLPECFRNFFKKAFLPSASRCVCEASASVWPFHLPAVAVDIGHYLESGVRHTGPVFVRVLPSTPPPVLTKLAL